MISQEKATALTHYSLAALVSAGLAGVVGENFAQGRPETVLEPGFIWYPVLMLFLGYFTYVKRKKSDDVELIQSEFMYGVVSAFFYLLLLPVLLVYFLYRFLKRNVS